MSCRSNTLGFSTPRMYRPLFDRGDLVRLLAKVPDDRRASMLASLGWAQPGAATDERESIAICDSRYLDEAEAAAMPLQSPVADPVDLTRPADLDSEQWPQRRRPSKFWIVDQHEATEALLNSSAPKPSPRLEWRNRPEQSPVHTPLAPWSVLTPVLRSALVALFESREIDVPRAVEAVAESRGDDRLPRRRYRQWGAGVQLIVDNSERLIPYFTDQDLVVESLTRLLGSARLDVYYGDLSSEKPLRRTRDGDSRILPYESPPFRSHVIVLGDLGVLESPPQSATERWLKFGRMLADRRCISVALVPCDVRRLSDKVRQSYRIRTWGPIRATASDDESRSQTIRKLLQLISFTVRVEPGLLRSCRRLLPEAMDPAFESEVWQDRAFILRTSLAGALGPRTLVDQLVREFEQLPAELREAALLTWRAWRQAVNCEVYFEELARLSDKSRALLSPEDWDDAKDGWRYLHQHVTVADPLGRSPVVNFARRLLRRLMEQTLLDSEIGHLAIEMRRHLSGSAGDDRQPPPPSRVAVFQTGSQLILRGEDDGATEPSQPTTWSRLASVRTQGGVVEIHGRLDGAGRDDDSGRVTICLTGTETRQLEIPQGERLSIRTDTETVRLRQVPRPDWADTAGRDRFGTWADVNILGVCTRWRWIPPGSFRMGATEDESEGWRRKGPQCWVTLTSGFWLLNTPVTQSLWVAIMAKNPSYFVDLQRPVEQVSWDDVQTFLEKLHRRVRKCQASLPTEAQWEYACRAGSTTALYRIAGQTGRLQLLGDRNAPALDPIAWYAGNSGVGFELTDGWDTSEWREMQYPTKRAGTRPVGLKTPNAWGLYDILGNVWEWCQDGLFSYSTDLEIDPVGSSVGDRCIRGGSWRDLSRFVSSAYRSHDRAAIRGNNLGFRLVRTQL